MLDRPETHDTRTWDGCSTTWNCSKAEARCFKMFSLQRYVSTKTDLQKITRKRQHAKLFLHKFIITKTDLAVLSWAANCPRIQSARNTRGTNRGVKELDLSSNFSNPDWMELMQFVTSSVWSLVSAPMDKNSAIVLYAWDEPMSDAEKRFSISAL